MINFIKKKKFGRIPNDFDVTVSSAKKNDGHAIYIGFHNSSFKKIAEIGEYMQIGLDGDRLYFCKSDIKNGYKLYARSQYGAFLTIPDDYKSICHKTCANLQFDEAEGFYYVELD